MHLVLQDFDLHGEQAVLSLEVLHRDSIFALRLALFILHACCFATLDQLVIWPELFADPLSLTTSTLRSAARIQAKLRRMIDASSSIASKLISFVQVATEI